MCRFTQIIGARRAARRGGFTLPEIIAVLTITAILAASAAPSMLSLSTTRAAAAGRLLVRDLTFARQRAMATGTRTWVVFDTVTDSWSVLVENPASPGRAGATALNDVATGKSFVQTLNISPFNGIEITAVNINSQAEIGFDWRGKPLNASQTDLATDGQITLTGGHNITIESGTGFAAYVAP